MSLNSSLVTGAENLNPAQDQIQTSDVHASDLLNELQEVLQIFKCDLSDPEVDSVSQFISDAKTLTLPLSAELASNLKSALTYAVDTQDTHVITGFFKQFSLGSQSDQATLVQIKTWLASQMSIN
jgi:methionine-rich copper-binding protein CopC